MIARMLLLAAVGAGMILSAQAKNTEGSRGRSWRETKCDRYRQAWAEVKKRFGTEGLGPDFIARHDAFLASGCTGDADVCPRSDREIEIANVLTVAAMNAGTASTFLPFACRR